MMPHPNGPPELLRSWPQRDHRVRVLEHHTNRGKGVAIRTALAASTAPVVIIQDADPEYSLPRGLRSDAGVDPQGSGRRGLWLPS
jgi:glycosyltransferase involved in cell wall biosynthesis